jgi:phage tail-like protein
MSAGRRSVPLALALVALVLLFFVGTAATGAGQSAPPGVQSGYAITLVVGEQSFGGFVELGGLSSENEIIELREVSDTGDEIVRKLPGALKFEDITLKRGLTGDESIDDLWLWRKQVEDGEFTRRDGSVVIHDQTGTEVARWNFSRGWPSKWTGPAVTAGRNEVATETITITVDRLDRD